MSLLASGLGGSLPARCAGLVLCHLLQKARPAGAALGRGSLLPAGWSDTDCNAGPLPGGNQCLGLKMMMFNPFQVSRQPVTGTPAGGGLGVEVTRRHVSTYQALAASLRRAGCERFMVRVVDLLRIPVARLGGRVGKLQ